MAERRRMNLAPYEKFVIFNVGAAFSLDTIYAVWEHPELLDLVEIVCIDPDEKSLLCGKRCAERLGVDRCFRFIPKKIEEAEVGQAHLILFIGMFCTMPTRQCVTVLRYIKQFLAPGAQGAILYSTVQERMLMQGPVLDYIMWAYGWCMCFKADTEPREIAERAGLEHEQHLDWEDALGCNRMTFARQL